MPINLRHPGGSFSDMESTTSTNADTEMLSSHEDDEQFEATYRARIEEEYRQAREYWEHRYSAEVRLV